MTTSKSPKDNLDTILSDPGLPGMFYQTGCLMLVGGIILTWFNLTTPEAGLKPGSLIVIGQGVAMLLLTWRKQLKWAATLLCWTGVVSVLPIAYTTTGLQSVTWGMAYIFILSGTWLLGKRSGYLMAGLSLVYAILLYLLHKSGHAFSFVYPHENLLIASASLIINTLIMGVHINDAFQRKFRQLHDSRLKLAASEAELFSLIDSTQDLVWSVSADSFRLVKFNRAVRDYFRNEYGVELRSGMVPPDYLPGEHLTRLWINLYQQAQGEEPHSLQQEIFGDGRVYRVTFNPLLQDGMLHGLSVFASDITEEINLRRVQEEQNAFEHKLIESIPGILYVFDQQGRYLMWNDNLLSELGVTADSLVQLQPLDTIAPEQRQWVTNAISRVFTEGSHCIEAEVLTQRGPIPYLLTGYRLDWQGSVALLGVGLDISERRAAEQAQAHYQAELEQQVKDRTRELLLAKKKADIANQAKSGFLANMSHEIRTPLTAIIGFSESLLQQTLSDTEREQAIQTVIRNGRHLQGLVTNILDFSRIEAGRLEIESTVFDLDHFLADIEVLGQAQAQTRDIRFSIHLVPPLPVKVRTDSTRLRQILINLLGNAIKFTNPSGRVRLILSYDPDRDLLLFTVQDSGIGIKQDIVRELFKPFTQADASTTRRFGGTGLGLSISRELTRLLGGDIEVLSIESLGSLFMVSLPTGIRDNVYLSERPEIRPVQTAPDHQVAEIPRLYGHVLVAEDTPDTRQLISLLLRRTGVRTTLVSNGQEALGAVQVAEFDLVLIDMQMPVMGGLEAVSLIRLTGFAQPIIILTANATEAGQVEAWQAGCDDFLTKPIDQAVFYATLQRYLSPGEPRTPAASPPEYLLLDDPEYLRLKADFMEELPGRLADIRAAAGQQDWSGLQSKAHQLKGIAGSYGFPEISDITGQIERDIKNGDYRQAVAGVGRLQG